MIVTVEGGVVQHVEAPEGVKVIVRDYDCEGPDADFVDVDEVGTTDEAGPLTHKAVEVGDDFLVQRDEAGAIESRIPVTAVRADFHITTKPK